MAFNPFIGWTQAQLEAELRSAQEDYAAGTQITSVGAGDTNVSAQMQHGILERIETLYRALNLLDPTTYPIASILPTRQTVFQAELKERLD